MSPPGWDPSRQGSRSDLEGECCSDLIRARRCLARDDVHMESDELDHAVWTDEELDAAVESYLLMLRAEMSGKEYKKNEAIATLVEGPLASRSSKAAEWRMQNISSVLQDAKAPWIDGYKPASHVGPNIDVRIRSAVMRCLLKYW